MIGDGECVGNDIDLNTLAIDVTSINEMFVCTQINQAWPGWADVIHRFQLEFGIRKILL